MNYHKLGQTDIVISSVALGCWPFGGGGPWGEQDDRDSIATVHAALDAGITFFDTAEGYGRSESVLGEALEGRRHEVIIATKVNPNHLRAAELMAACESSLQRLRTDTIDLYQIHWPNHGVPIDESMAALTKLREQGKIRAAGVSNFGVRDLSGALSAGQVDTNQISYSLIWRAPEYEIQPLCVENGAGIICWGPLVEGLLTGKFGSADEVPPERRETRYFSGKRPETSHGEEGCEELLFATIARVASIARRIGHSLPVVGLAWLLHQPGVTAVLAGARRPHQIRENACAGDLVLDADVIAELSAATDELKRRLGPNQDMYLDAARSRIV